MKGLHLIHCGSSVTLSPGVTRPLRESLGLFVGRTSSAMSTSPSESKEASSESWWATGIAGAGGRIEIAIVIAWKLVESKKNM